MWIAGQNCQANKPTMPTSVVQNAVFLRHNDGQNIVQRNTSVKAVVRLKPINMTLTMPTALKASHKVPMPIIRIIKRLAFTYDSLEISGLKNRLKISCATNVLAPNKIVQAVETSAAQSAANVMPEEKGSKLIMICGSAMVGFNSGNCALAASPKTAQKKPTGKINRPPRM